MIDTRSSKPHIDINLVSTDYLQALSQPIFTEQMNRAKLRYDKCIKDAQMSFYTVENAFDEYNPLLQVWG